MRVYLKMACSPCSHDNTRDFIDAKCTTLFVYHGFLYHPCNFIRESQAGLRVTLSRDLGFSPRTWLHWTQVPKQWVAQANGQRHPKPCELIQDRNIYIYYDQEKHVTIVCGKAPPPPPLPTAPPGRGETENKPRLHKLNVASTTSRHLPTSHPAAPARSSSERTGSASLAAPHPAPARSAPGSPG